MNKLLFTAKGLHLSLVTQRPITQDVQLASGASQEYFFGLGASHYRTNTDLEESILRISGMVAYRIKVALSGKGLANFISSRQCPCLLILNDRVRLIHIVLVLEVESLDYIRSISPPDKERDESYKPDIWNRRVSDLSPPGKRRKLRDERSKPDIWNRRFQNPIRQENVEQFKAKVNAYEERGFSSDKAIHLAAYDDLPSLCKRLRRDYAQFLMDYYELQEDPVQQRILESAKTFRNQHDMNQADSIRQAIKLRKDLFMDVWPNHNIETEKASEDQEDSTTL